MLTTNTPASSRHDVPLSPAQTSPDSSAPAEIFSERSLRFPVPRTDSLAAAQEPDAPRLENRVDTMSPISVFSRQAAGIIKGAARRGYSVCLIAENSEQQIFAIDKHGSPVSEPIAVNRSLSPNERDRLLALSLERLLRA